MHHTTMGLSNVFVLFVVVLIDPVIAITYNTFDLLGRKRHRAQHFLGHRLDIHTINQVCGTWRDTSEHCPKEHMTNLCEEVPELCQGGEYARCQMPQLPASPEPGEPPSAEWQSWADSLNNSGITFDLNLSITLRDLVSYGSSQTELSACEVCGMYFQARQCVAGKTTLPSTETCAARTDGCFCVWASGIAVSATDHKILDGHHRWAATKFLVTDTQAFSSIAGGETDFLNRNTSVESYDASVSQLQRLGRSNEAVNSTDCNAFDLVQSGANNMAMPMAWILLGLLSLSSL